MPEDAFAVARNGLADAVAAAADRHGLGPLDPRVLRAIRAVPRHRFVPETLQQDAYRDRPLPIGAGQTVSQPFIVALMTHLLGLGDRAKVLEIGTGCGYQTAILAEIAAAIFSVETIPALQAGAAGRLAELGYRNIRLRLGDGWEGWPEAAPFDAILVTAAATRVPERLVAQLGDGGTMVLPVGPPGERQWLRRLRRTADGVVEEAEILPVAFVPLVETRAG